jgi:hypothetical protein
MKRMVIFFFVESLFGSKRRRVDWSALLFLAGIAIAAWLVLAVR